MQVSDIPPLEHHALFNCWFCACGGIPARSLLGRGAGRRRAELSGEIANAITVRSATERGFFKFYLNPINLIVLLHFCMALFLINKMDLSTRSVFYF